MAHFLTTASGEITAERVFREHKPRVSRLALRMLNNESDAEDVTQDVFVQVVRKLATFRGEARLSTWLHRVTVHAALAHLRQRARSWAHTVRGPGHIAASPRRAAGPVELALAAEQRGLVATAIEALPAPVRAVYVMADVEGEPAAAIAGALGLSTAAVKSRLHRARRQLRNLLAPRAQLQPFGSRRRAVLPVLSWGT